MRTKYPSLLPKTFRELFECADTSRSDKLIIGEEVLRQEKEDVGWSIITVIYCYLLLLLVAVFYNPILLACASGITALAFIRCGYRVFLYRRAEFELMSLENSCYAAISLDKKQWVCEQEDRLMAIADALACEECHLPGDCSLCGTE